MIKIQQITASKDEVALAVSEMLAVKPRVVLRARGRSMEPYIHDGTDNLVLVACDRADLRVGQIVMVNAPREGVLAHRIIAIDGDTFTLKGDGNLYGTEICHATDIIAKVRYIERRGRIIDCDDPHQIRRAAMLRALTHPPRKLRAMAGRIVRRIFK